MGVEMTIWEKRYRLREQTMSVRGHALDVGLVKYGTRYVRAAELYCSNMLYLVSFGVDYMFRLRAD